MNGSKTTRRGQLQQQRATERDAGSDFHELSSSEEELRLEHARAVARHVYDYVELIGS